MVTVVDEGDGKQIVKDEFQERMVSLVQPCGAALWNPQNPKKSQNVGERGGADG